MPDCSLKNVPYAPCSVGSNPKFPDIEYPTNLEKSNFELLVSIKIEIRTSRKCLKYPNLEKCSGKFG